MTWNYRVLRRADKHGNTYLAVAEVYYKENGDIDGWSAESVLVAEEEEGVKCLKDQLRRMLSSLRLHPDVIDVVESEERQAALKDALREGAVYPVGREMLLEEGWRDQTVDYDANG